MKQFFEGRDITKMYQGLEEFKRLIRELSSKPLAIEMFPEIEKSFKENIGFFPFMIEEYTVERGTSFYRVRIQDGKFSPDTVGSFKAPPAECVTAFQRLTVPQHRVFYTARTMDVAAFETFYGRGNIVGSEFFISEWQPGQDKKTIATTFLFTDNIISDLRSASVPLAQRAAHILKDLDEQQTTFAVEYLNFITNEFVNPSSYVLSSYTAYNQMYATHQWKTQVFIYPTVKKRHNGINIAFRPDFAENYLAAVRFYHCKVLEITDVNIEIQFLRFGVPIGDRIEWRGLTDDDMDYIRSRNQVHPQ